MEFNSDKCSVTFWVVNHGRIFTLNGWAPMICAEQKNLGIQYIVP